MTCETLFYFMTIWNQFFSLWKIRKYYSTIIVIMFDCIQLIMYQYGKCLSNYDYLKPNKQSIQSVKCTKNIFL